MAYSIDGAYITPHNLAKNSLIITQNISLLMCTSCAFKFNQFIGWKNVLEGLNQPIEKWQVPNSSEKSEFHFCLWIPKCG